MHARIPSNLAVALCAGLVLAGLFDAWPAVTHAQPLTITHYVAPSGQCGAPTPCYAHPQAAVDAANPGDEIRIAAGTYRGVTTRNGATQLLYVDKQVTVRGGYDPATWVRDPAVNATILDAEQQGRVLYVKGQGAPVFEGLHLTRGSGGNGGGVYVETAAATLRDNQIYSNWVEGHGAGVYLKDSTATLTGNHIYTNTTGPHGRGGGLAVIDSPAAVTDNLIEDNRAHVGGGVILNNTLSLQGAQLTSNTIRNNVAFELEYEGRTFDGAGGGLDLRSYMTDTLRNNIISGNTAGWGGGVHDFGGVVAFVDNTFQENHATVHGGGLYVQTGWVSLETNDILSNTAAYWGGGLTLFVNGATVKGNTFRGNNSGSRGGGMYAGGAGQFDGNLFLDNIATDEGGGIFLYRSTNAVYQNTVVVGNHAAQGGGLHLWAVEVTLLHSTIANNSSGDGRAVVIDKYPGIVSPGDPTLYTSTVVLKNSIVAGQPTGLFATSDNNLTVEGVLWHAVATPISAAGASVTRGNEFEGDPRFYPDGYHLQETDSAAQDRGFLVGVDHDVDRHKRPVLMGIGVPGAPMYDLGADEIMPVAKVIPETGGSVGFFDISGMTMTVSVPPRAIPSEILLQLAPVPPAQIRGLPIPLNTIFGPALQLNPFVNGIRQSGITPTIPISLTVDYTDRIAELHAYLNFRSMTLRELIKSKSTTKVKDGACGPIQVGSNQLSAPLCRLGPPPAPPAPPPPTRRIELQVLLGSTDGDSSYLVFVAEIVEQKLYLPLMRR